MLRAWEAVTPARSRQPLQQGSGGAAASDAAGAIWLPRRQDFPAACACHICLLDTGMPAILQGS
jgi:hypothetical protein